MNLNPICFTVDVEDGISISMRDNFNIKIEQTSRVESCTQEILKLLDDKHNFGTFFILGQVAQKFPQLIHEIANAGHEVAVHGFNHYTFNLMSKEQAFQELDTAKKLIEDITGQVVKGHRAPAFSVTPQTIWAFDVIAKAGFVYDSSVLPAHKGAFHWTSFPEKTVKVKTSGGHMLYELPISIQTFLGKKLPFSGGGYFRLLPYPILDIMYKNYVQNDSAIFYVHPYEVDIEKYPDYYYEVLRKSSILKSMKMRSYWINRKFMKPKIEKLLNQHSTIRMDKLLENKIENQLISVVDLQNELQKC